MELETFQIDGPLWVFIPLALGIVLLTWWSYHGLKSISVGYRYLLIALRSLALLLILFLLLQPVAKWNQSVEVKPEMLVMLDNSQSTSISKGTYQGEQSYREAIEALNLSDTSEVSFSTFRFASSAAGLPTMDSLTFTGSETHLYNAVETINNRASDERVQGAILFTDGIFTQGRDPSYFARNIDVPIYTIGLGDTTSPRDLIVRHVVTDEQGYTNTSHTVRTTIQQQGFDGQTVTVNIKKEGRIIESRNVELDGRQSSQEVTFGLQLQETGLQQFLVEIPTLEEEWSDANNQEYFAIDVLDNKTRILHASFEIHPDVRSIRNLLATDRNISLSKRTWLGSERFVEGEWPTITDSLDLLILHGYPSPQIPQSLVGSVESSISSELPVIFVSTPRFSANNFGNSSAFYPINWSSSSQLERIALQPAGNENEHPILELPEVSYDNMPRLIGPVRELSSKSNARTLLETQFQNTPTGTPLLSVLEIGNRRSAAVAGYEWYRLFQSTEEPVRAYTKQLWLNIVNWASSEPDTRRLKVRPTQQLFNSNQPAKLVAFLTNESGERETEATIDVELETTDSGTRTFSMRHISDGEYRLDIGRLPEGLYQFSATATKGERQIDQQQGEFRVAPKYAEYVDTRRNESLLFQLAQSTGGAYLPFEQASQLRDSLSNSGLLETYSRTVDSIWYFNRHFWWFVTALVLLTAEWVIRKYIALP